MSGRRILGIGALVAVAALVTVVAVGLWSLMDYGRECASWFSEGLLGPDDQRQRVETPHGFAISMSDDWTAEAPRPTPTRRNAWACGRC